MDGVREKSDGPADEDDQELQKGRPEEHEEADLDGADPLHAGLERVVHRIRGVVGVRHEELVEEPPQPVSVLVVVVVVMPVGVLVPVLMPVGVLMPALVPVVITVSVTLRVVVIVRFGVRVLVPRRPGRPRSGHRGGAPAPSFSASPTP
ncbi:hypothetical protein GCM10025866_16980 [Naasia aerilata]|uniref:Uncharacterized protein n=1 Tax=Naasia aerilata TaxID=1162966 RepID=A0ABN6XLN9_9MICO|nr:hypothetical protein GCM10025866_16980 [Naasia aerilata]